jgi:hypothetical protein
MGIATCKSRDHRRRRQSEGTIGHSEFHEVDADFL